MCYYLYDLDDNLICFYQDVCEIKNKLFYEPKEINRKFRNSSYDFILLYIDNKTYKLYKI
uniref:Uncharacterized protein n=1 Tax=Dulem virus 71 TaxID=3145782 RepID=A0AAU8AZD7_9VIRU